MRFPAIALVCVLVLSGCLFAGTQPPKQDGDAGLSDAGGTPDTGVDCLLHATYDGACFTLCRDVDPDCPQCDASCDDHEVEVASCEDAETPCRTLHACGLRVYCAEVPICEPTCRAGWEEVAACRSDRLCEMQTSCGQEIACARLHCDNACEAGYVEIGDSCEGVPGMNCFTHTPVGCDWEVACDIARCEPECPQYWALTDNCEGPERCEVSQLCGESVACRFECGQNLVCPETHVEHHTCEGSTCLLESACGLTITCVPKACDGFDTTNRCPENWAECIDDRTDCQPFYTCGELVHCKPSR